MKWDSFPEVTTEEMTATCTNAGDWWGNWYVVPEGKRWRVDGWRARWSADLAFDVYVIDPAFGQYDWLEYSTTVHAVSGDPITNLANVNVQTRGYGAVWASIAKHQRRYPPVEIRPPYAFYIGTPTGSVGDTVSTSIKYKERNL